ncbi:protease pro-enzyme activation domain-containing protein [Streptomyces sp. NPDC056411]|uniref:S53 family peptidase n=1 Tax=Streptomyces sp. NPDC056411 TaxID=3345813 RepID=UPI0035D98D32
MGPVEAAAPVEATVVLRRRAEVPHDLIVGPETISQAELAQQYGADPADVDLVGEVLGRLGLRVIDADPASRRVTVSGTAEQMAAAFRTELSRVESPDPVGGAPVEHRHREGQLHVPAELDGVVVAVLGLDDRPQARPHLRHAHTEARRISYRPTELANVYHFPPGTDGSGQSLALIELGGGFRQQELETYFSSLGLPTPRVTAVSVGGARNHPGEDADDEVLLDIEVAGALAPGAEQQVYFAPNTDSGFVTAVSQAVHATPTPAALSISWGAAEESWTEQARMVFDEALADAAALGVTVCVAAGDDGSADGIDDGRPHTDFPASSPHALACGGTRLDADAATGEVRSERVWGGTDGGGATGGGVSTAFRLPIWQNAAGVPHNGSTGRGVPDVSGVADPATGYEVLINGRRSVIGGTSAVAPLWAALTCRLVQELGRPLGLLHPLLYAGVTPGHTSRGFREIIDGSNGAFQAGRGWNACTGLGVPDGTELLASLRELTHG